MSMRIQPYSSSIPTTAAPADPAKLNSTQSKAERVYRLTLGREKAEAAVLRLYSAEVSALHDTIADVSAVLRNVAYEFPSLANHPALSIAGITTAFSMGNGANAALVNIQQAFKAAEIDDYHGLADRILNGVGGIVQATAGTAYLGIRVASVAANVLPTNTTLPAVANILGYIGNGLFSILYLLFAITSGLKLYQGAKLRNKVTAQGDSSAQLQYLQNRVHVTGGNALSHLAKKWKEADLAKLVNDSGMSKAELQDLFAEARKVTGGVGEKEVFMDCLKEAALKKHLEKEAVGQLVKEFKGLNKPTVDLETFARSVYSVEDLTRIGLDREIGKMQARREAKLSRLVGAMGLQKIKECDLTNAAKVQEVMTDVHGGMDKTRNINIALLAVSIVAAVAMVAACILTGGVGAIVITAILFAVSLAFIGIDGYFLHQAMKNGEPGINDKKLLMISAVASLVMMGTAFAITSALSLGIIPLVIAGVIGLVWLGVTLYAIHRSKGKVEDLELEQLRELLANDSMGDHGKKVLQAFEAMPPEKINTIFQFLKTQMTKEVEAGKEFAEMAKHLDTDKYHAFLAQLKKQREADLEAERMTKLEELYKDFMGETPEQPKGFARIREMLSGVKEVLFPPAPQHEASTAAH